MRVLVTIILLLLSSGCHRTLEYGQLVCATSGFYKGQWGIIRDEGFSYNAYFLLLSTGTVVVVKGYDMETDPTQCTIQE